jgi:hypothetical protein
MIFSRRAQSIMEYVLLISIITAAVVFMLPRVKRTTQSMIKSAADQIGDQRGADQTFNIDRGYLISSNSSSTASIDNYRQDDSGKVTQGYDETTTTTTSSLMGAGWSKE